MGGAYPGQFPPACGLPPWCRPPLITAFAAVVLSARGARVRVHRAASALVDLGRGRLLGDQPRAQPHHAKQRRAGDLGARGGRHARELARGRARVVAASTGSPASSAAWVDTKGPPRRRAFRVAGPRRGLSEPETLVLGDARLRSLRLASADQRGRRVTLGGLLGHDDLLDVGLARQVVHRVEEQPLEDRAQTARAGPVLDAPAARSAAVRPR